MSIVLHSFLETCADFSGLEKPSHFSWSYLNGSFRKDILWMEIFFLNILPTFTVFDNLIAFFFYLILSRRTNMCKKADQVDKKILFAKYLLKILEMGFNSFVPNAPFLYTLTTSENLKVFWCFQGVEKGCIGSKCVNQVSKLISLDAEHWILVNRFRTFYLLQLSSSNLKIENFI